MTTFADKRSSLTDWASFALMERLGLAAAISFDSDFRDCGYQDGALSGPGASYERRRGVSIGPPEDAATPGEN